MPQAGGEYRRNTIRNSDLANVYVGGQARELHKTHIRRSTICPHEPEYTDLANVYVGGQARDRGEGGIGVLCGVSSQRLENLEEIQARDRGGGWGGLAGSAAW